MKTLQRVPENIIKNRGLPRREIPGKDRTILHKLFRRSYFSYFELAGTVVY